MRWHSKSTEGLKGVRKTWSEGMNGKGVIQEENSMPLSHVEVLLGEHEMQAHHQNTVPDWQGQGK